MAPKPDGTVMPEIHFLLISQPGGRMSVENLDEYTKDDEVKQVYLDSCEKYGSGNVRYCKVVGIRVRTTIEFIPEGPIARGTAEGNRSTGGTDPKAAGGPV